MIIEVGGSTDIHSLKKCLLNNSSEEGGELPVYIERIILDECSMPDIWDKILEKDYVDEFIKGLMGIISYWLIIDKTPNYQKKDSLKRLSNSLNKIDKVLNESQDVNLKVQAMFDEFMAGYSSEYKNSNLRLFNEVINYINDNIDASGVDEVILRKKNKRTMPTKLNEKSSFRTYLIKNVYLLLDKKFSNKKINMVANIVSVMLEDALLTEDDVRKALN